MKLRRKSCDCGLCGEKSIKEKVNLSNCQNFIENFDYSGNNYRKRKRN